MDVLRKYIIQFELTCVLGVVYLLIDLILDQVFSITILNDYIFMPLYQLVLMLYLWIIAGAIIRFVKYKEKN